MPTAETDIFSELKRQSAIGQSGAPYGNGDARVQTLANDENFSLVGVGKMSSGSGSCVVRLTAPLHPHYHGCPST